MADTPKLDSKAVRDLLTGRNPIADNLADQLNLSGRAGSRIARANKIARLDDTTDEVLFRGQKSPGEGVGKRIEEMTELQETIDEFKADGMKPKVLEKVYDKTKKTITKDGKKILRDFGKAVDYHQGAMEAIDRESLKVQSDLFKDFEKELKKLQDGQKTADEAGLKALKENVDALKERHSTIKDAVKEHFDTLKDRHVEAISEIKTVVGDIEKSTGLSAAEHMGTKPLATIGSEAAKASKGIMTELEYEKLTETGKFGKKVEAVFKSGPMGMVQTGLMALGGVDGFRRIIEGGSDIMSGDPERQNGWSKVFIGVPEVAVAGWIGQMGGHGKVLGHG